MTTSYSNTGGTGDRRSIISATTNISFSGSIDSFLNGSYADGENYFTNNGGLVVDKYMRFYFTESYCIDELTWRQQSALAEGYWKVQSSIDGNTWIDLSSIFILGYPATTIVPLNNKKAYPYYQIIGVSGNYYYNPWLYEVEFKIGPQPYVQYLHSLHDRFRCSPISTGF